MPAGSLEGSPPRTSFKAAVHSTSVVVRPQAGQNHSGPNKHPVLSWFLGHMAGLSVLNKRTGRCNEPGQYVSSAWKMPSPLRRPSDQHHIASSWHGSLVLVNKTCVVCDTSSILSFPNHRFCISACKFYDYRSTIRCWVGLRPAAF